jgi:hypothetical protein
MLDDFISFVTKYFSDPELQLFIIKSIKVKINNLVGCQLFGYKTESILTGIYEL